MLLWAITESSNADDRWANLMSFSWLQIEYQGYVGGKKLWYAKVRRGHGQVIKVGKWIIVLEYTLCNIAKYI